MKWLKSLKSVFILNILIICLAGCSSFRAYNMPEVGPVAKVKQLTDKTKIYVQEGLKPQDSGEVCMEWHGCLWHGKDTLGERIANQLTQVGASSYFVGLSRQERFANSQFDEGGKLTNIKFQMDKSGGVAPGTLEETYSPKRENPYKKKLELNQTTKSNLGPDEYWIDSKIRFVSNGPGEWFLKSLLTGFTLTMVPVWQEISTEVDLKVTNYKQEEIWSKKYKDSYTGMIWFFLFPVIYRASTVPDDITENIARTAVNDMIQSGVFSKKELSVSVVNPPQ